jgi:hypothetical protein
MTATTAYEAYKGMSLAERRFMADTAQRKEIEVRVRVQCALAYMTLAVFEGHLTPEQREGYMHSLDQQWGMIQ